MLLQMAKPEQTQTDCSDGNCNPRCYKERNQEFDAMRILRIDLRDINYWAVEITIREVVCRRIRAILNCDRFVDTIYSIGHVIVIFIIV